MNIIFDANRIYKESDLYDVIDSYNLVPTDCIKDDNEITVSDSDDGEPIWTFRLVDRFWEWGNEFYLEWYDEEYINKKLNIHTPN